MSANLYTSVTINDTEYQIKKFDARTGLKLARLVISKLAPIIPLLDLIDENEKNKADNKGKKGKQAPAMTDEQTYRMFGQVLGELTDEDMDMLVDKCLRVCYVNLKAGPQPVIDEVGNYGVEGVEYDLALTLRLCFEAIKWGASDFFGGNVSLSSLLTK